jgi:hypothetical protein
MSAINVYVDGADNNERNRRPWKRIWSIALILLGTWAMARTKPAQKPVAPPIAIVSVTPIETDIPTVTAIDGGIAVAEALPPPDPANAVVTPGSLDFGERRLDRPGSAQLVTIRNAGGVALPRATLEITPPYLVTNGCSAPLDPGSECVAAVVFAPAEPGRHSGALTIIAGGSRRTVRLSGSVPLPPPPLPPPPPPPPPTDVNPVPREPDVTPLPESHGELCVNPPEMHFSMMGRKTVTLTNSDTSPQRVAEITPQGEDGTPGRGYVVQASTCLRTLAPGERCTFFVQANALAIITKERITIKVAYEDAQTGRRRTSHPSDDCNRRGDDFPGSGWR